MLKLISILLFAAAIGSMSFLINDFVVQFAELIMEKLESRLSARRAKILGKYCALIDFHGSDSPEVHKFRKKHESNIKLRIGLRVIDSAVALDEAKRKEKFPVIPAVENLLKRYADKETKNN